jgi:hypothetical protein
LILTAHEILKVTSKRWQRCKHAPPQPWAAAAAAAAKHRSQLGQSSAKPATTKHCLDSVKVTFSPPDNRDHGSTAAGSLSALPLLHQQLLLLAQHHSLLCKP